AKAREGLRDMLEILRTRAVSRAGEAVDLLRGRSQGIARALLAQHLERPEQLVHGLVERRELFAFRRVAEEGVQNLLDRAQVGTHFRDNLVHEQPFLRSEEHLVEQGDLRCAAPELAENAIFQARTQKLRLLGKLAGKMR